MTARKNVSNSGSGGTRRQMKRSRDSCDHHWILSSTKYPVYEDKMGQVNLGRTGGRCKKCGKTKRWEAPTPDSIYGMDSIISCNIRLENGTLPEGFGLEDDYDA